MYSLIDCINVNSIIRRLYDRVVSITNLVSLDLDAANDKLGLIFNRFTIYKYTSEIGQLLVSLESTYSITTLQKFGLECFTT